MYEFETGEFESRLYIGRYVVLPGDGSGFSLMLGRMRHFILRDFDGLDERVSIGRHRYIACEGNPILGMTNSDLSEISLDEKAVTFEIGEVVRPDLISFSVEIQRGNRARIGDFQGTAVRIERGSAMSRSRVTIPLESLTGHLEPKASKDYNLRIRVQIERDELRKALPLRYQSVVKDLEYTAKIKMV